MWSWQKCPLVPQWMRVGMTFVLICWESILRPMLQLMDHLKRKRVHATRATWTVFLENSFHPVTLGVLRISPTTVFGRNRSRIIHQFMHGGQGQEFIPLSCIYIFLQCTTGNSTVQFENRNQWYTSFTWLMFEYVHGDRNPRDPVPKSGPYVLWFFWKFVPLP